MFFTPPDLDALANRMQESLAPIHVTPITLTSPSIPSYLTSIHLDISNFISQQWEIDLLFRCDRKDVADYIRSQRENKPIQSLSELAAQVVALHVVLAPSDKLENPVGSDPNFKISQKSGNKAADEKVREVISAAQSSHERKLTPFNLVYPFNPVHPFNLVDDGINKNTLNLIFSSSCQQREPFDLSLLHHNPVDYDLDEKGVAHPHVSFGK